MSLFWVLFPPTARTRPIQGRREPLAVVVTVTTMADVVSDLPYYFTGFQFK